MEVLGRMGVLGEVRRLQTDMGAVEVVDERGRRLSSHSAGQVRLGRYSRGRVVLVGDAGYGPGPGGMGSGLAVVGAYVLAGELAAAGGDHRAAFAGYEGRMRPYVAVCQGQARGVGGFLVPRTRARIRLRNLMWRALPYLPWRGIVAKMTARAADSIALEDYPGTSSFGSESDPGYRPAWRDG